MVSIELEIVSEDHRAGRHVAPNYVANDGFEVTWWAGSNAKTPAAWCRFLDEGEEVARAKILFNSRVGEAYPSWTIPPSGSTEIDLIEVPQHFRRTRKVGRRAVECLVQNFSAPFAALSLDDDSDAFWRSLGWQEHLNEREEAHPSGCRRLFTFSGEASGYNPAGGSSG